MIKFFVSVAILLSANAVWAETFSCGQHLSSGTHILTKNISCPGGMVGLYLDKDNTTFDCKGWTFSQAPGPRTGTAFFMGGLNSTAQRTNIHVKNCNLRGWQSGLWAQWLTYSSVENSTTSANTRGVVSDHTAWFTVLNSHAPGNVLSGMAFLSSYRPFVNGGSAQSNPTGIWLSGSAYGVIQNVTTARNGTGILLDWTTYSTRINGGSYDSLAITDGSFGNMWCANIGKVTLGPGTWNNVSRCP